MRLLGICLLVVLVVGALVPTIDQTPAVAQNQIVPRYEVGECHPALELPYHDIPGPHRTVEFECGYLYVYENREKAPDTNIIKLPVYTFPSRLNKTHDDPLVFLTGGPGQSTSRFVRLVDYVVGAYNIDRDVIMFDQRGTGLAEPALLCPEYGLANFEAYATGLSLEVGAVHAAEALIDCVNRYKAQGIDVNAYRNVDNAADLAELRVAMGIDEWNLYGVSYGTRLALTAMREFPEGIRSVVLDSIAPPQMEFFPTTPTSIAQSLNRLFELCQEDVQCNGAYPNLERIFYELIDRLDANPRRTSISRELDRQRYDVLVDGSVLVTMMFNNLYSSTALAQLPYVIYSAYAGDYGPLDNFLGGLFLWDDFATVMHYAINCHDELAFNTFEEIATAADAFDPRLAKGLDLDNYITWEICQRWETDPIYPAENEAVVSDIPTLILVGELDPVTPPRFAEAAIETLPNSYYFQIPGAGHSVTSAFSCAADIMRRFLNDPTIEPEHACLLELTRPRFLIIEVRLD